MKNKICRSGLLRARVTIALAILALAAPLYAGDPSSTKAAKSKKQALWVSYGFGFSELKDKQIRIAFGVPNSEPGGLTFGSNGNFWGTFCHAATPNGNGLVFELTQNQLREIQAGGSVKPKVEFEDPNPLFDCPSELEFDKSGNLWVANSGFIGGTPSIMKYSADQLTTSGKIFPAAVFKSPALSLSFIWDIRFDSSDDLWIAAGGHGTPDRLFELTSEQLSETGSQPMLVTPNLALDITEGQSPEAIAFDQVGNLWVGRSDAPLLLFAASDLSGTGTLSPAPLVTIDPATLKHGDSSFSQTSGLAVDDRGNLWVASSDANIGDNPLFGSISEFKTGQITSSGSPKPGFFLPATRKLQSPSRLTFGPQL